MKKSIYQQEKDKTLAAKALILYKQGLTLREVGKAVDKSHEWVRKAISTIHNGAVDKN